MPCKRTPTYQASKEFAGNPHHAREKLSSEREAALFYSAKELEIRGDVSDRNLFMEHYLGLAKAYAYRTSKRSNFDFETLFSEAQCALFDAYDDFDPQEGRFTTRAVRKMRDRFRYLFYNRLKENGKKHTFAVVRGNSRVVPVDVIAPRRESRITLDYTTEDHENSFGSTLALADLNPSQILDENERSRGVSHLVDGGLGSLSEYERRLVMHKVLALSRTANKSGHPMSNEEIGAIYGVSREKVRKEIVAVIEKLRDNKLMIEAKELLEAA